MKQAIACLNLALLIGFCAFAHAEHALKHDPFARPLLIETKPESVAGAATAASVEEDIPWQPTLSAVLVAGQQSLATVDGVILKLGDEKDGYRLVQVKNFQAIFKKGKKRVVLTIEIGTPRSMLKQNTEQVSQ